MSAPPPDWILAHRQRIGDRIREERRRARLTQEEVANRIGLDRPSMVEIEQGQRNMTINTFIRIADALNVPLADLVR